MKNIKPLPPSESEGVMDWDGWLAEFESNLKELRYTKYTQHFKTSTFAYWKSFYDEDAKIYQVGILFYDYRKQSDTDPRANRIGVQYECLLIGRHRIDLSVSKDIDVPEFELMAKDFYEAMWKYCL
jgi:hypothetical protein